MISGDDSHNASSVDANITAPKYDISIEINVDDIKVGDKEVIVVKVSENATGNVTIEIDGIKYTKEVTNGEARFEIENLTSGLKSVYAKYSGDDFYNGCCDIAEFEVNKRNSTVSVTIDDIFVGDKAVVNVYVPENATGQAVVEINGVGYNVVVKDGKGTVEIPYLPNGTYDVSVTYSGDDQYLPSSNTTKFTVSKVPSFVIPDILPVSEDEDEVIRFTVPEDATGTITVIIDGVNFTYDLSDGVIGAIDYDGDTMFTIAVSDGKGVLVIGGLPAGEYNINITYNGDDKYLPSSNNTKFNISQKVEMKITDLGNGTLVVNLPENATGNITVEVGGNNYTVELVNGTASVDLINETPGVNNVVVVYSGDDVYPPSRETAIVDIPKYKTPLDVSVDDIHVGDNAVITVTVPNGATGDIVIEIDAKSYTAQIKDGKAVFEVPDLTYGNKTVAVKYDGDNKYLQNFTTAQFKVEKNSCNISATVNDITVGKNEVITVYLPDDATGRVLVDVNGIGYYADVVNGKAKVVVPDLPSGKYKATVTYEGDDKYLEKSIITKTFTVSKVKAPISVTDKDITEGESATVIVHLPEDATGTVTIVIDGKKYTQNIIKGQAIFSIPGLTRGIHDIDANYSGDKKYEANSTITDIEVRYLKPDGHHNETHYKPDSKDKVSPAVKDSNGGVELSDYPTGNPILILLLILMTLTSTQIRRFKK